MKAVALLVIYLACVLGCYKYCNGHGNCGPKDKCECYLGWGGADCSLRSCPYGEALVDIPLGDLNHDGSVNGDVVKTEWRPKYGLSENLNGYVTKSRAHRYAECSNSGSCNRESGDCECYKGYEGTACQRRSCPTSVDGVSCSGNGICMSSTAYAKEQGSSYYGWELDKFYTCKCDAGYEGVDCSLRQCPYGVDPVVAAGALSKVIYPKTPDTNKLAASYTLTIPYGDTEYQTPTIKHAAGSEICNNGVLDTSKRSSAMEVIKRAIHSVVPLSQATVDIICTGGSTNDVAKVVISSPYDKELKTLNYVGKTTPDESTFTSDNAQAASAVKLCGGRGLCDSKTGLCSCFTGYYGYACENQRTIQL